MDIDIGALRDEADRLSKTGGANNQATGFLKNFVKIPDNDCTVLLRILPPATPGMFNRKKSDLFCQTRTHRVNGKSIHCPRTLQKGREGKTYWGGDCEICNYYNALWQESKTKGPKEAAELQAQARAIKPVERYYYNVIVRDQEEATEPKIWSVGKKVHAKVILAFVGNESMRKKPLGNIADPDTGRDFLYVKEMTAGSDEQMYASYNNSEWQDPSPLGSPDEVNKWMAGLHDLASLRIVKPQEELKLELKKHLGLIPNDDTKFDMSEYRTPLNEDDDVEVVETPKVKVATKAPLTESKAVVEDDFFAQLNNIIK